MPQTARPVVWEGRDAQSSRLHPINIDAGCQHYDIGFALSTQRNAAEAKI
jgi:hypothetical protein